MKDNGAARRLKAAAHQLPEERKYWQRRLAGLAEKSYFPYDFPPGAASGQEKTRTNKDKNQQNFKAGNFIFTWEGSLFEQLMKLRNESDPRLHMILAAGLVALLAKYTGSQDIIIGTPIDRQPETGTAFINTILPIRVQLYRHMTFRELLLEIRSIINEAVEHRDYPIEYLAVEMNRETPGEEFALFNTAFLLENLQDKSYIDHLPLQLIFSFRRTNHTIEGKVEYCFALYQAETIREIAGYLTRLMKACLENVNIALEDIDLLMSEEKKQLLDFNNTAAPYPMEKTIHELFQQQVRKTPDHIALVGQSARRKAQSIERDKERHAPCAMRCAISYRELDEKSHQLAYLLNQRGVRPDNIVGIMLEPSLTMIIGILAILKAGGAYLPIDPDYPQDRIDFMLKDSSAKILLTSDAINRVPTPHQPSLHPSTLLPFYPSSSSSLAYIIYTSGSTGKPKGVMVEHRGLVNYSCWAVKKYIKNEPVIFTLYTSIAFDLTLTSLFPPLLSGNTIKVYSEEGKGFLLDKILAENRVNVIKLTPVHLKLISGKNMDDSVVRRFILGGEQLESQWAETIHKNMAGRVEIYNEYGPTEAVVGCMIHRFNPEKDTAAAVPIGVPADNVQIHLLDNHKNPVPPGFIGEIYIAGRGLARGYLNNPELTAEKFCLRRPGGALFEKTTPPGPPRKNFLLEGTRGLAPLLKKVQDKNHMHSCSQAAMPSLHHPIPPLPHPPIYRTGDLARRTREGDLVFIGRKDEQVKIRGFRVEPEEIQKHLSKHELVDAAVVTMIKEDSGYHSLCAYIVPCRDSQSAPLKQQPQPSLSSLLRDYLSKKLPDYMVPSYFVELETLPITPNGKIDCRALPKPGIKTGPQYQPPTNKTEETLAKVWAEVLGLDRVGIDDEYFSLGGDSIKAIQISARLQAYNLKLEMRQLFQYPFIRQLSSQVTPLGTTANQESISGEVKLTPIQQWFFQRNFTDMHHFNQSILLHRPETFNREIIEKAFNKLLEHHDALRMIYKKEKAEIKQVNKGITSRSINLNTYEIKEKAYKKIIEEKCNQIQASIDLSKELVKLGLFKTCAGDYLLIVIHHLVIDGVSWRILLEDFSSLYRQLEAGTSPAKVKLPLKTTSYKEWADKLSAYPAREELLNQLNYWKRLDREQIFSMIKDTRPRVRKLKDNLRISRELANADTEKLLKEVHRAYNTEITDILLAGLGMSLTDWRGLERVVIDLEGHGREDPISSIDVSRTIGWFTSVYPVVLDMTNSHEISLVIKNTKEMLRKVPHRGFGYGILKYLPAKENQPALQLSLEPEIGFNYWGQFDEDLDTDLYQLAEIPPGNPISPNSESEHLLEISGIISKGKLRIFAEFNREDFTREEIETLLKGYEHSLRQIIDHCMPREETELTISDFSASIDEQEAQLVFDILDEKKIVDE